MHGIDPYTYRIDVLQRVGQHPASRVADLTPRQWKALFADSPMRSDLHGPASSARTPAAYRLRCADARTVPSTAITVSREPVGLGGVAGIVVGWFASPSAAVGAETVSTLSLPFMLAFLAGYGIEAVFRLLDRLSRALGDVPKTACFAAVLCADGDGRFAQAKRVMSAR